MNIFIVFLIIFNIVSWIVFLIKFKSLFTTDDIVNSTNEKINELVRELNNNAFRDVSILDEKSARLENLINEADRRLKLLDEMQKRGVDIAEMEKMLTNKKNPYLSSSSSASTKSVGSNGISGTKDFSSNRVVNLTNSGQSVVSEKNKSAQKSLFDEDVSKQPVKNLKTENQVIVTNSGASYTEIPILSTNITSDESVLKNRIIDMYNAGKSVEQIAERLNCSETEVQFALSLGNVI